MGTTHDECLKRTYRKFESVEKVSPSKLPLRRLSDKTTALGAGNGDKHRYDQLGATELLDDGGEIEQRLLQTRQLRES